MKQWEEGIDIGRFDIGGRASGNFWNEEEEVLPGCRVSPDPFEYGRENVGMRPRLYDILRGDGGRYQAEHVVLTDSAHGATPELEEGERIIPIEGADDFLLIDARIHEFAGDFECLGLGVLLLEALGRGDDTSVETFGYVRIETRLGIFEEHSSDNF